MINGSMNQGSYISFKKNFSIYFLSNLVAAVVPFILLPYLTRVLSPSEYGIVAVYVSIYTLSIGIVGGTYVGAINREFFKKKTLTEYQEYILTGVQLSMVSFIFAGILLLFLSNSFGEWLKVKPIYIEIAFVSAFFKVIYDIKLGQLQIRKMSFKYGLWQVSKVFLSALLTIICIHFFDMRVDGRIFSLFTVELIFFLLSFLTLSLNWRIFFRLNIKNLNSLINFGIPLIPHVVVVASLAVADRIVIANILGLNEAGIYLSAMQIAMAASLVFDGINKAYVPWLYERLTRDVWEEKLRIVKNTYIWFLAIIFGVVIAILIKDSLVDIILGKDYKSAKDFIGWIFVGMTFKGMYLMVTNYCFYAGKTAQLSIVSFCIGFIYLCFLFIFVGRYGLTGAAIVYAVSSFLRFIIVWFLAAKYVDMPWLKIFGKSK